MPEDTLELIASLTASTAANMVASYTAQDWQESSSVDDLRKVAEMLRLAGRELPISVIRALKHAASGDRCWSLFHRTPPGHIVIARAGFLKEAGWPQPRSLERV